MKKMVRKGFSMIELLFVMVILASLAAIAIPSMSSGSESAALTSMRSDAKNTIALLQSKFIDSQDYAIVTGAPVDNAITSTATATGLGNVQLGDKTNIPLSKDNKLTITAATCTVAGDGFIISIENDATDKTVSYDSCKDGKIQVK